MMKKMLDKLEIAIESDDSQAVKQAIFDFGNLRNSGGLFPDEIAFGIIDILRRDEMKASPFAGHILNFFEFESPYISAKAKDRCIGFLEAWGDEFKHTHSMQVVLELRSGNYLHDKT
jgi:hypothetical protein